MNFPLPQIGEGLYEAELIRWLVHPGDPVKPGQGLLEVMTDKATMEVPSPFAGRIQSLIAEPGAKIQVGQTILDYQPANAALEAKASNGVVKLGPPPEIPPPAPPVVIPSNRVAAAPSVRHLARQLGLNLAEVTGSGPGGRILMEDIARAVPTRVGVRASACASEGLAQSEISNSPGTSRSLEEQAKARTPTLGPELGKAGTTLKIGGLRRKIGEHLTHSKNVIPHFSYMDECDATELVRLKKALREPMRERDVKLTFLPFFVKAVAQALKQFPIVNSSLDDASETIRFHSHYHIGIAVAAPAGLIVPVVRDADKKDLPTIAREIEMLGEMARAGKSRIEDLKGSTFTVSSVGNIGGLISTPIINHPEVGILGIGKIVKRPVYGDDGQLRPADIVYLSFSFDHRVVDGAVGAMFANRVIEILQHPAAMLLGA